jgi:hypothetical protein
VKQRCRYCRCTWDDGCPLGCWWVQSDLCSVCANFIECLSEYIELARRPPTKSSLARMLDEVTTPLEAPIQKRRSGAKK